MGNIKCNYYIGIIALLSFLVFSCSEDELTISGTGDCTVGVKSFSNNSEASGGGKLARWSDTPDEVYGYEVKVKNISHTEVAEFSQEFIYDTYEDWYNDPNDLNEYGIIDKVTQGQNMFTAVSIGRKGTSRYETGWNQYTSEMSIKYSSSYWTYEDYYNAYRSTIEDGVVPQCKQYKLFRDTVYQDIYPNQNNFVDFDMKIVNGRLIVVIENLRETTSNRRYKVYATINGEEKEISYNKARAFVFNDNTEVTKDLVVDIDIYQSRYHHRKGWLAFKYQKTITKTFSYEPGKDKIRIISVTN